MCVFDRILNILNYYRAKGHEVIFLSGREDVCRQDTQDWLIKHVGGWGNLLFMRAAGDKRKDYIVKKEIYEREIKCKYNVHLVLDDRNQVVQMWRNEGLVCWQVQEGDF